MRLFRREPQDLSSTQAYTQRNDS